MRISRNRFHCKTISTLVMVFTAKPMQTTAPEAPGTREYQTLKRGKALTPPPFPSIPTRLCPEKSWNCHMATTSGPSHHRGMQAPGAWLPQPHCLFQKTRCVGCIGSVACIVESESIQLIRRASSHLWRYVIPLPTLLPSSTLPSISN